MKAPIITDPGAVKGGAVGASRRPHNFSLHPDHFPNPEQKISLHFSLYFPLIPISQELLKEIQANQKQNIIFQSWTPEAQEEFLDFCTGVKEVKTSMTASLKKSWTLGPRRSI